MFNLMKELEEYIPYDEKNIFDTSNLSIDETYKEIINNDRFLI